MSALVKWLVCVREASVIKVSSFPYIHTPSGSIYNTSNLELTTYYPLHEASKFDLSHTVGRMKIAEPRLTSNHALKVCWALFPSGRRARECPYRVARQSSPFIYTTDFVSRVQHKYENVTRKLCSINIRSQRRDMELRPSNIFQLSTNPSINEKRVYVPIPSVVNISESR